MKWSGKYAKLRRAEVERKRQLAGYFVLVWVIYLAVTTAAR